MESNFSGYFGELFLAASGNAQAKGNGYKGDQPIEWNFNLTDKNILEAL